MLVSFCLSATCPHMKFNSLVKIIVVFFSSTLPKRPKGSQITFSWEYWSLVVLIPSLWLVQILNVMSVKKRSEYLYFFKFILIKSKEINTYISKFILFATFCVIHRNFILYCFAMFLSYWVWVFFFWFFFFLREREK